LAQAVKAQVGPERRRRESALRRSHPQEAARCRTPSMYSPCPVGFMVQAGVQPFQLLCADAWEETPHVMAWSTAATDGTAPSPGPGWPGLGEWTITSEVGTAACDAEERATAGSRGSRRRRRRKAAAVRHGESPWAAAPSAPGPVTASTSADLPQVGTWIRRMPAVSEEQSRVESEAESEATAEAATDGASSPEGKGEDLGDPLELAESSERSSEVVSRLEMGDRAEQRNVLNWLLPAARQLALSRHGCRAVQKALEVAGGPGRDKLVTALEPHAVELYESLHGNHVLTKIVEMMPSASLRPLIGRLVEKGPTVVARHRFGCRVLERLIEHCSETEIGGLVDEIIADSEAVSRHPYGNFVIQHLLEHGMPHRRAEILRKLNGFVPQLAMHRTASHVVQRALDFGSEDQQRAIVGALLKAEGTASLVEVACTRYGSFVVEQLAGLLRGATWGEEVLRRLNQGLPELGKTPFGLRVVDKFGLQVHPGAAAAAP